MQWRLCPWLCPWLRLGAALAALVVVASAQDSLGPAAGSLLTGDDFSRIQFILYTPSNNASYPIADVTGLLADSGFDASKPTVLYMHGWRETNNSVGVGVVSRAFLQRGSHNFVLLDWGPYVAGLYITSFARVSPAGVAVGAAVNRLVEAGLSKDTFWIVGHSLGGQLAGVTAKNLDFKPTRITGLDPAGPGFFGSPATPQLTRDDGDVVDVIHTDGGFNGYGANEGTVDFWPNGGRREQPGCNLGQTDLQQALFYCSHWRSWRFFAESVNNENAFPAVSCPSWLAFQSGSCPPNDTNVVYMGYAMPATTQTGAFYLRTASEEPFGLGEDGLRPENATTSTAT